MITAAGIKDRVVQATRTAIHAVDQYTSPRELTHGNFKEPSLVLAIMSGAADGFMMYGPLGAVQGAGTCLAALGAHKITPNRTVSCLAAAAAGTALAVATAVVTSAPIAVSLLATNAVFGVFEALHRDPEARRRDSAAGVTLFPMLLGPTARLAGAVGSGTGQAVKSKLGKMLVGAATGATLAAGLTLLSAAHAIVLPTVALAAVASAVGPFLGPRLLQTQRNLMADIGTGLGKVATKLHLIDKDKLNARIPNMFGTIPVILTRSFMTANGNMLNTLLGAAAKSAEEAYILWAARGHVRVDEVDEIADSERMPVLEAPAAKTVENPPLEHTVPQALRP